MQSSHRPPSLTLVTSTRQPARPVVHSDSPSPTHQQSQSPFRYIQVDPLLNEKVNHPLANSATPPLSPNPSAGSRSSPCRTNASYSHSISRPSPWSAPSTPFIRHPTLTPSSSSASSTSSYTRPRGLRIANLLKQWMPVILYALTSLGFLVAIALFRTQLFAALDDLSTWLRTDGHYGHAVLFSLIFLTTFPPLPLYSTLIVLSGYTFGAIPGFVLSYAAALSGATTVFLLSRTFLSSHIDSYLSYSPTTKRMVFLLAKPSNNRLLLLVRIAPYPYNVMNCLLATAPGLSLARFVGCTALSLFKVAVHVVVGAGLSSFRGYHTQQKQKQIAEEDEEEEPSQRLARMWTIIGVGLAVVLFVYLSWKARKAVDAELGGVHDDENTYMSEPARDEEEAVSLLSPRGFTGDVESEDVPASASLHHQRHHSGPQHQRELPMVQSPLRSSLAIELASRNVEC